MIRVLSVVMASVLLSTCGDMSELQEDELRQFVRKAKRVAIDELFSDYDDEQIETAKNVLVEVLTEDDEIPAGDTVTDNRCREVGRKTVFSAKDLPLSELDTGVTVNLSARPDGLECSAEGTTQGNLTSCRKGACSCEATGQADASLYRTTCVDQGITGANREKSFTYKEDEVLEYGEALPDTLDQERYFLLSTSVANKKELEVFTVSLIGRTAQDTTTLNDDKSKSLYVYNGDGQQLTNKLARWPSRVDDDIFEVQLAAGIEANFDVFLVKDGRQSVKKIAGYVDDELSAVDFIVQAQDRTTTLSVTVHQRPGANEMAVLNFSANPDPGPLPIGSNAGIDFISVDSEGIVKEIHQSGQGGLIPQLNADGSVRIASENFACQVGNTVYVRVRMAIYQATCQQGN